MPTEAGDRGALREGEMIRRGIDLIKPGTLTITQSDPEFSPLVSSTLGDNLTDADGWDKDLADLAALFNGGDDLLAAMAQHLVDADFVDGAIDSGFFAPLASSAAGLLKDGEPLFDGMVDAVTPPAPAPPPNPPPNPPPGGGGGGGGGGGSGVCTWRLRFNETGDGFVWVCEG